MIGLVALGILGLVALALLVWPSVSHRAGKVPSNQPSVRQGSPQGDGDDDDAGHFRGRALGVIASVGVVGLSAFIYTQIGRPDLMTNQAPAALASSMGAQGGPGSSGRQSNGQVNGSASGPADGPANGQPGGAQDVTPDQIVQMVDALAQRLQSEPDNIEGWVLLGRSYMQMGQFGRAAEAFGQARARIPSPEDELDLSYAEARILNDQGALTGPPGEIVERILAAHPDDVRASLYGGLRALALNDEALAIARFESILAMDVPDDLREVVEARLASIGASGGGLPDRTGEGSDSNERAGAPLEEGDGSPSTRPVEGVRASGMAVGVPETAAASDASTLSAPTFGTLQVEVAFPAVVGAEAQAAALAEAKALFVFARSPQGGPPLAVKRIEGASLPRELELSDADAMLPGNRLSVNSEAILVARLSMSGSPMGGAGDWVAEVPVTAPVEGPVRLELKPPQD